jgi:hypothetical protein
MRVRTIVVLFALLSASSLAAKDVYLSVGGSANGFFTDARIVNPSFDKDITITARYLPAGNIDNANVATKTVIIPKRSQVVYDDVVNSLFGGGPALGAIRLTSDDDFLATQRIYADKRASNQRGTLGQFVPGLDATAAIRKGIVMQLKAGEAQLGNFRTNWGGANPNPVVANIDFTLYDKNNTVAGTNRLTVQPFGVISPTNINGYFGNPNRDLTDGWISFDSDQPVFIYGSIVDNGSEDPTFVTALADSGVAPPPPPPPPDPVVVTIVASDFNFAMSQSRPIRAGDQVRFRISQTEGVHGFRLGDPDGEILFELFALPEDTPPTERLVTLPAAGQYTFVCTNSGCGTGHFSMVGEVQVQP